MIGTRQIARQLDILRILQVRLYGARIKKMAGEFDVTEWTIQRDLLDLSEAGFPVYSERKEGKLLYWHLQDGKNRPSINFPFFALRRIPTMLSAPMRRFLPGAGTLCLRANLALFPEGRRI